MKRSPLQRRTELKRTGLLNRTTPRDVEERPATKKPRRKPISAASPAQRAKVKGLPCARCGRYASEYLAVDPAHVCPRSLGGCDDADCVVPLCRGIDGGCHKLFDDGEIDLLPDLEPRWRVEQAHAVIHLGLEAARTRVVPSQSWRRAA